MLNQLWGKVHIHRLTVILLVLYLGEDGCSIGVVASLLYQLPDCLHIQVDRVIQVSRLHTHLTHTKVTKEYISTTISKPLYFKTFVCLQNLHNSP